MTAAPWVPDSSLDGLHSPSSSLQFLGEAKVPAVPRAETRGTDRHRQALFSSPRNRMSCDALAQPVQLPQV